MKSSVSRQYRLTRIARCHTPGPTADQSNLNTILNTERNHCCLIFGVQIENELTNRFAMKLDQINSLEFMKIENLSEIVVHKREDGYHLASDVCFMYF